MTPHTSTPGRAPAAATGFLVGGAAGFLLTEAAAVLVSLALGEPLDVGGGGLPRLALVTAVLLCALAGALAGLRRAGRSGGPRPEGGR
ncbi:MULTISPECIES: hypothetical protein [Streptomyces]|uniref:Uncharacterized protein n=1 Tax=Streptomyces odorifer TaxID=53450 RepID=A0A7Y6KJY5_9ACTN|nr:MULTISPECIES: hypothetical protein [Streptomyces]NUV36249.1 hypothetical protein [Streptomyces sp. KAI-27]NUV48273.1 hypothetical protein [Streptomyces sp. CAI-78]MBL0781287.1 hypothetical protein [Streptomyces albidoflavus]MCR0987255.1 hypothetical protein [Streptomyces albidoflavus]MDH6192398.1 hypothetical protein [Streptomyces sp. CZ24]